MAHVTEIRRNSQTEYEGNARLATVRARLGSELEHLTNELTQRIPTELGQERSDAEYRSMVESQKTIQRRVRLLGQLIAGLQMVDPETIWDDYAGYGSAVLLRDLDSGREIVYTLMAGELVDVEANQVSLASPIGQALLGRRAGEETWVEAPQGRRRFRILTVSTLPRSLGLTDPITPDAA